MADQWPVNHPENAPEADLERRLQAAARSFRYPPAPDLAARERARVEQRTARRASGGRRPAAGLAWALLAVVLAAGLMLASPARARVLDWLRVGAVRIFLDPNPGRVATPEPGAPLDLAGETTLAAAAEQAPFALRLPAYPPDLGKPQRVFVQQVNGTDVVIFVWLQPEDSAAVRLALYQVGSGEAFEKALVEDIQQTSINGETALWVAGPHLLLNAGGEVTVRRVVAGRTLIWSAGGFTYRLETDLPLDEARKIAESLEPLH